VAAVEAERFQEAIAILTQALDGRQLKSVEEIGLAYWHRGRAKASLDDCAGAIPDWEEAMALDASPDVYSSLGFCHFQLNQYEEAIPYLGFDAKNFPNAATFTLLGKAQALTDDFDGAEASFRSALELTPDYADAKKGLALSKSFVPSGRAAHLRPGHNLHSLRPVPRPPLLLRPSLPARTARSPGFSSASIPSRASRATSRRAAVRH
jgi:tetratricopeptide (TPR) repeat protein